METITAYIPCPHEQRGLCWDHEEVFVFKTHRQRVLIANCRLFVNQGVLSSIMDHLNISIGTVEHLYDLLNEYGSYNRNASLAIRDLLKIPVENQHHTKNRYWLNPIEEGFLEKFIEGIHNE